MNKIDTSQLLTQLRMAATQARGQPPQSAPESTAANFSSLLSQSIDKVNELGKTSGDLQDAFQLGKPGVSLTDVMMAKAKSGIAFEGMVQVRNKVAEAYQTIMRMSV